MGRTAGSPTLMHTGATGPDPFPGRIRKMLEQGKAKGLPFQVAWQNALELFPASREWAARGSADCSPLEFAKRVFAHAYAGIPLTGDLLSFGDRQPPRAKRERDPPRLRTDCRFGGGLCNEQAMDDSRFCPEHTHRLACIRDEMGVETARLPNRQAAAAA